MSSRGDNVWNAKKNWSDRYKQMTKQQQLIEEKKRQIQEKQEEQKRREEALKKAKPSETSTETETTVKKCDSEPEKPPLKSNIFSNDGSFLDQFRKMSKKEGARELKGIKDRDRSRSPVKPDMSQPPPLPPPPSSPPIQIPLVFDRPPPPLPFALQNIHPPSPIIPQTIPPPGPMNVRNIPPPSPIIPQTIPPPVPPPNFNVPPPSKPASLQPVSSTVPADNIQGFSPDKPGSVIKKEPEDKSYDKYWNAVSFVKKEAEDPVEERRAGEDLTEVFKTERISEADTKTEETKATQRERRRKSRWGEKTQDIEPFTISATVPTISITGMSGAMLSKVTRTDPGLLQYAITAYGSSNLTDEDWKKAEDNYKVHLLYQDMMAKKAQLERLAAQGKNKYEYDSDEEVDGGTWEHKLREKEMIATKNWAESLTEMAKGKHHIGDFLPPDELKRFMDKYTAVLGGKEPDLSDYKEFKLKEDNKGFQMLQKLGWTEGQGLGSDGGGILDPINKAKSRDTNQGLGVDNPGDVSCGDDEYDAYRKRMMLAYRFRPNPLNNPRRPYY